MEREEARLQIEQKRAELEREIGRRGDEGCARVIARDINRRILEDDEGPPCFARTRQNIAAMAALLEGLPNQALPKGRHGHQKLRTLIERTAQQQVECSMSQR
jgi:hypothetical protein